MNTQKYVDNKYLNNTQKYVDISIEKSNNYNRKIEYQMLQMQQILRGQYVIIEGQTGRKAVAENCCKCNKAFDCRLTT